MGRVLITGGTGFVGHWLKETRFLQSKKLDIVTLNHEQYDDMSWVNDYYDYIIHAANVSPIHAVDCARRNHAKLLYISSGAVYHTKLNEYGKNKVDWENMLYFSDVNFSIARLFTFCGTKLKWDNYAIGTFIKNCIKEQSIRIWGDGTMIRSYMYGTDLGIWLWKILFNGEYEEAYDVGSPHPVTMLELANEVRKNFSNKPEIIIENRNEYEQAHIYLPNTVKAQQGLGLDIKFPFELAIQCAVEDYYIERII